MVSPCPGGLRAITPLLDDFIIHEQSKSDTTMVIYFTLNNICRLAVLPFNKVF